MYRRLLICLSLILSTAIFAQSPEKEALMVAGIETYFAKYKPKGQDMPHSPRMESYRLDNGKKTLTITADGTFALQEFTPKIVSGIYKKIRHELPKPYAKYKITVYTNGIAIDDLVPNQLSHDIGKSRLWGDIDYNGKPWVTNASCPIQPTHGLQNRHLSLWASHGRYYDEKKACWKWQRPNLFGTTEDLYTQTIVVPYLIPMLENAGAVVFTPRERDWQRNEFIIDNDGSQGTEYIEVAARHRWETAPKRGFAQHGGTYSDGENPFLSGTARMAKSTKKKNNHSLISYQPRFVQSGRYAVYVSYQTLPNSIDDAHYTVWHKGGKTDFYVNQRMGGGTWVYLGTFDFDRGSSEYNRVVLTNQSARSGLVTADAVRFGGGMGNIQRGGTTSGLPRSLEAARYYAQWAGMPYSVYSSKNGMDDYSDDINVRPYMTNYLAGGSCYVPSLEGRKVPIELALALHSDAGYTKEDTALVGSLAIYTTGYNDGRLNAGISRMASRDFAAALLSNAMRDIKYKYGRWNKRELFDRNYSETRNPEIPSAILETMSHQNFSDMRYGQDPNFRFTLARSIYKTILRYVNDQHGRPYIVTPLAPDNFSVEVDEKGEAVLSWSAVDDPQEATSRPTGYIVYTAAGKSGFDNGTYLCASATDYRLKLEPNMLYHFKVAATNRGGRSFPTETLSALYSPEARKTVLIVNGFYRLSSPAIRNTPTEQGFDLDEDIGITYGSTAGWAGRQICFDRDKIGIEGEGGLGWGGDELAGMFIAGNDFNYVCTHAEAIETAKRYNIASCSSKAVETGKISLTDYAMVDLILGLERYDGRSLAYYKAFSTLMQAALRRYVSAGGRVLASGAYVGSDMTDADGQRFLAEVLKCRYVGSNRSQSDSIRGMGTYFQFHRKLNEKHYAATSPDALQPVAPAYTALQYADGQDACIAYSGRDYRTFTMGFPFECITDELKRGSIMRGILNFLLQ